MQKSRRNSEYPLNWTEMATSVKEAAGSRCARCRHPAEKPWKVWPDSGDAAPCDARCKHQADDKQRILTVHHLDMDPSNSAWWNLAPLCQVCHLAVQTRYHLHQYYLLRPPAWLSPYIQGWALAMTTGMTVVNLDLAEADIELVEPWHHTFAQDGDLMTMLEEYESWIVGEIERDPETYDLRQFIGKTVGCRCKSRPCEGHIIVDLVAKMIARAAIAPSSGVRKVVGRTSPPAGKPRGPRAADAHKAVKYRMRYFGRKAEFRNKEMWVVLKKPKGRKQERWGIDCPICNSSAEEGLQGEYRRGERHWRFLCKQGHVLLASGPQDGIPEKWRMK